MTYKESFETFSKRFQKNLKIALEEAGMSQRKQLLAGLDPRYIARIKKGEGNPTLMTIWRICKTTGIDPEDLFRK
jgi:transcriptional regulator with XRE-family HTH domain